MCFDCIQDALERMDGFLERNHPHLRYRYPDLFHGGSGGGSNTSNGITHDTPTTHENSSHDDNNNAMMMGSRSSGMNTDHKKLSTSSLLPGGSSGVLDHQCSHHGEQHEAVSGSGSEPSTNSSNSNPIYNASSQSHTYDNSHSQKNSTANRYDDEDGHVYDDDGSASSSNNNNTNTKTNGLGGLYSVSHPTNTHNDTLNKQSALATTPATATTTRDNCGSGIILCCRCHTPWVVNKQMVFDTGIAQNIVSVHGRLSFAINTEQAAFLQRNFKVYERFERQSRGLFSKFKTEKKVRIQERQEAAMQLRRRGEIWLEEWTCDIKGDMNVDPQGWRYARSWPGSIFSSGGSYLRSLRSEEEEEEEEEENCDEGNTKKSSRKSSPSPNGGKNGKRVSVGGVVWRPEASFWMFVRQRRLMRTAIVLDDLA